jgi:hypothetical protein
VAEANEGGKSKYYVRHRSPDSKEGEEFAMQERELERGTEERVTKG